MNFRNQARVWEAEQANYELQKRRAAAKVGGADFVVAG